MDRGPRAPIPRPQLESDPGRTSGQLLDILISRRDWEGARTYLERLQAQNPALARPRLVEVLVAQARATEGDEDAQLDLWRRVRDIDENNAEARGEIERISKARAERARGDAPQIVLAAEAGPTAGDVAAPALPKSAPTPEIEVRDAGTEAAIRRAREEEQKARAAAETQLAALASERERLLEEARAASAERERLGSLLQATMAERERLSVDLEIARTSQAGGRPSLYRPKMSRTARRALFAAAGLAIAGAGAIATVIATRPARIEIRDPPFTLVRRDSALLLHATAVTRIGTRQSTVRAKWVSRNPLVAQVDADGAVTPIGTGVARIEAADGDLTASVEVKVSLPARIVIEPGEVTLSPDHAEAALRASVLDGSGAPWEREAELEWTSSAPAVAPVASGKVREAGIGEAVITASLGDLEGRATVHALDRRSAAEAGCHAGGMDACVDLGHLLETTGVATDDERAGDLYEKACAAGTLRGCVAIGERRERGKSGAPDVKGALAAYKKACDGAHAPGCTRLGHLYETTVRDAAKALASYRTACDAKDLEGCWRLGTVFELGHGVAREASAAADLHKRACDGGLASACTSLANMRWNGSGAVAKDEAEALALFEKACDARSGEACLFLALKYKAGEGVALDARKAAAYFGKACDAGHQGSCAIAGRTARN